MRIVLFLGAGASVPYGMPTTRELRDKLSRRDVAFPRKDLLDLDEFPDIEHVLFVLDQLLSFMQSRAGRLYERFKRTAPDKKKFDKESYLLALKRLSSYVDDSRNSKEIIEQLITRSYAWNPSNDKNAKIILRPLLDLAKSKEGHITVFTTNYDTSIEEYCRRSDNNIECVDGFEFHNARRMIVWNGKFVPQIDAAPTKVFLYKIHGSLNWLAETTGDRGSPLQKPDTSASGEPARDMYVRPSLDVGDEAAQKEPYATILRRFVQILPSFDACIVIGYSFRDPHISEELVKFARSGKILVLLSPTGASDFENNVLKKNPTSIKKSEWHGDDNIQTMMLGSESVHGVVCAVNKKLTANNAGALIDAIRSLLKKSDPYRKAADA